MEQQWKDIKTAYNRVLDNTFTSDEEKDKVHVAVVRMISSAIDLLLSGDPAFMTAMQALGFASSTSSIPVPPTPAEPPHSTGSSTRFDPSQSFSSLLSAFDQLPSFSVPTGNGSMNNEDFRSLFPFFSSIIDIPLQRRENTNREDNTSANVDSSATANQNTSEPNNAERGPRGQ